MNNYMNGAGRQLPAVPKRQFFPNHQQMPPMQQPMMTSMPTMTTGMPGVQQPTSSPPPTSITPQTLTNTAFLPAYLKTQIGRHVRVEFLIGTNILTDREGTLVEVGANYIIIQETRTNNLMLCDLFAIKFVKIFY